MKAHLGIWACYSIPSVCAHVHDVHAHHQVTILLLSIQHYRIHGVLYSPWEPSRVRASLTNDATLMQDNERHKECRVAVTAVAAYKERKAEELRARLDSDEDMPVARRQLKA